MCLPADIVTKVLDTPRNIFQIRQTSVQSFAQIFLKFNLVWTSLKILQTQIALLTSPQSEKFSIEIMFGERREKWRVVLRKFQKKKLKKHFFIHLIW